MGGGNGQKSAQKRERNQAKAAAAAGGKSQLKQNQAAMNKKCKICMQPFLSTTNNQALEEHAQNKHSKTAKDCFPEVV